VYKLEPGLAKQKADSPGPRVSVAQVGGLRRRLSARLGSRILAGTGPVRLLKCVAVPIRLPLGRLYPG